MILVGCGKAKLAHAAPARELYTGSLFRAARAYADVAARWERNTWAIVSGVHGLLDQHQEVEPYEGRLPRDVWERERWAERIALEVTRRNRKVGELSLTLLMGADYADPLGRALERQGWDVIEPLKGMGLGTRLRWLTEATRQLRRLG